MDVLGDVGVDGKWQGRVGQVGCMKDGFGEQHPILWTLVGEVYMILEFCGEAEMKTHVGSQDGPNDNLPELLYQTNTSGPAAIGAISFTHDPEIITHTFEKYV